MSFANNMDDTKSTNPPESFFDDEIIACYKIRSRSQWYCKYGFRSVVLADKFLSTNNIQNDQFDTTLLITKKIYPSFIKQMSTKYKLMPEVRYTPL